MARHCTLDFHNPVTGKEHHSLLGYVLNQYGVPDEQVQSILDRGFSYIVSNGVKSWGKNRTESPFIEPSIEEILTLTKAKTSPGLLSYVSKVQDFYDSKNLSIDTKLNIHQLHRIIQDANDSKIALEYEVTNPDAPIQEQTYRLYPMEESEENALVTNNALFKQVDSYYAALGKTRLVDKMSKYLDLGNPTIYNSMRKILNDDTTTQYERDLINTLLSVLDLNPSVKLNLSYDLVISREQGEISYPAATYDLKTNSISVYLYPSHSLSDEDFKRLLIHETVHAVIASTLENPQTTAEKVFASEIARVWEYYKQKYSDVEPIGDFYGLKDQHEFVSEFLTNPTFRASLEETAPEVHGSTFQSIINFIKKLLGAYFIKFNKQVSEDYVQGLLDNMFETILDNQQLNTSMVYVGDQAFNSEGNSKNYQQFLESMPGMSGREVEIFYERLREFLESDSVNWNTVLQNARQNGINAFSLEEARETLNNIDLTDIPVTDLQKSFESLVAHLYETTMFLRGVQANLSDAQRSKTLSQGDLYSRSYHAAKMGEFFKDYITQFRDTMYPNGQIPPANTVIAKYMNNINAISDSIINTLNTQAAKAVAGRLAEEMFPQTKAIRKGLEENITRLENELVMSTTDRTRRMLVAKIKEEKERLTILATPENLEKALLGTLDVEAKSSTGKLASHVGAMFESAAISGNLVSGTLDSLINNLWSKSTQEAMQFQGQMKVLADELSAHLSSKGINANTGLDFNKVFSRFLKRVTLVEIKNGNLIERDTLVLQSRMDEVSYTNDWTRKKFAISKIENIKNRTPQQELELQNLITDLTDFEEKHLESYYTDEYHRIQSLLSPVAKARRDDIIDKMRKIQLSPNQGENSEEDLDKLDDLKAQLDSLEQDTDEYGVTKSEDDLEIARSIREWKQERSAATLFKYEVTPKNKLIFQERYNNVQENVKQASSDLENAKLEGDAQQVIVSQAKYDKAVKDLEAFKKANVVKRVSPEFYEERADIIDAIAAIQSKYRQDVNGRTVSDVYKELFSLLKPYKNVNGEYEGSKVITEFQEYIDENGATVKVNIPTRVRQLQSEIEDIRQELSEGEQVAREDKDALVQLYSMLGAMQERLTTEDYGKALKNQFNIARQEVLAKNSQAFVGLTESEANKKIMIALRKGEWYKMNHRKVYDYGSRSFINEPLFHWMVTLPKNPAYISETEPSFRWYTTSVNDEKDPITGRPKYVNPAVKESRNSKRVLLKANSTYSNSSYNTLDDTEKSILDRITALYEVQQKGLPRNLRKGLELPSVRKSGLESLGDKSFKGIWDETKSVWQNTVDSMFGRNDDDLSNGGDTLLGRKGSSKVNQYKDRLHLKYVTPIDADQMTVNFFDSITQFGSDSIRFKNLYSNLPYILGARDLINKNLPGTVTAKVVNNLLERKINGQGKVAVTDVAALRVIGYVADKTLGLGASMALSLNLPSSIKNFQAGTLNIYNQLGRFGLEKKEIHAAMARNAGQYWNLLSSQIEEGKNTPYIAKMKYFSIMPSDTLSEGGKKLFITNLDKSAKYNPIKHLTFFREFGEFEMRSAVAEVMSKQHLVKLNNGSFVPILEAYTVEGNMLVPRDDIADMNELASQEQYYRNRLNAVNSLIHGNYGAMDKGEYARYNMGRVVMYMKGWLAGQWLSRFGSRRMAYSAGMEFQGMYITVYHAAKMLFNTRGNFATTGKLLSEREKDELVAAGLDTMSIAVAMLLSTIVASALYSDDDDDQDNLVDYFMLYNLLYLEDELSSLHPLAGSASIYYSRVVNNVDGKDFFTYYFNKNILMPFRSVTDIMTTLYEYSPLGDVDMFADYVPRSRAGRVLNPKRYQRDPFLDGQPEVVARLNRLWAINNSVNYLYGGQEFMYRRYEYSNPKWFIPSYKGDLRSARKGVDGAKKEIKAIEQEIRYVDDLDTKAVLEEKIDKLQKVIQDGKEQEEDLKDEYGTIDRK